jgi:hypothetical protein
VLPQLWHAPRARRFIASDQHNLLEPGGELVFGALEGRDIIEISIEISIVVCWSQIRDTPLIILSLACSERLSGAGPNLFTVIVEISNLIANALLLFEDVTIEI